MVRGVRLGLACLAALTLTAATGCGSVNAGSAAADEFRTWMANTEHVASLELSADNTLPWSGSLSAGVVVEPDATAAQIAAVAQRATSFDAQASLTFSIGYTRGDFVARFAVYPGEAAANLRMIELAADVDQSTEATEFTAAHTTGNVDSGITVTGPGDFLAGFDQLRAMIAAKDVRAGNLLTVQDEAATFSIVANRGTGAAGPRAAYEAVRAQYRVTAAQLTDTTADLRVDAAQTPAVVALARRAAPAVTTTAQFGTATTTTPGDYTAAHALLARVTAAGAVVSSELAPGAVRVVAPDLATVLAMHAAVGDGPLYGGVSLDLQTVDRRFDLYSSAGSLAPYLPALDELWSPQWATLVSSLTVRGTEVAVTTAELTSAQLSAAGAALSRLPAGTTVTFRPDGGIGFSLVAARTLTARSPDTFGEPTPEEKVQVAAFVSGWNAEPAGAHVWRGRTPRAAWSTAPTTPR